MKTILKNTIAALSIAVMISSNLYAQDSKEASEILKDKQKKEQVFSAILENPKLKNEMMQRIMSIAEKDSASCKMMGNMMMDDTHMMDMMMSGMMDKAESDDRMCKKMCMMMMVNDKMMNMMDEMKDKKSKGGVKQMEKSGMNKHMDNQHNE